MSGGAYNYLYTAAEPWSGRLGTQRADLERMRDRLDQLAADGVEGAHRAAFRTRVVLAHLERADTVAQSLTQAWHAVEWRDSGDWGREQMTEVLAQYERGGCGKS